MTAMYLGARLATPALVVNGSKYGATIDTFLGDVDANGVLQQPTVGGNIVLNGVQDIADGALVLKFRGSKAIKRFYAPDLAAISGESACLGTCLDCTELNSVDMPELLIIGTSGSSNNCYNMFAGCTGLLSINLPKLATISYDNACYEMFAGCNNLTNAFLPALQRIIYSVNGYLCYRMFADCPNLASVDISELIEIAAKAACYEMFAGCTGLTTFSFDKLENIFGQHACYKMFADCTNLKNVYFPSIKTLDPESLDIFEDMFLNAGASTGLTVHFPSNAEAKIQRLTGYPTFGADSSIITLAFDLPATE